MGFEFNPADEDPHGECRHEIQKLQADVARLERAITRYLDLDDSCDYVSPSPDNPLDCPGLKGDDSDQGPSQAAPMAPVVLEDKEGVTFNTK